jgi:hypothetical protein
LRSSGPAEESAALSRRQDIVPEPMSPPKKERKRFFGMFGRREKV